MNKTLFVLVLLLGPAAHHGLGAGMRILPADVALTGPHAAQQLIVLADENGRIVGDRTDTAGFSSSNPAVATVDAAGVVRPAGDGEAIITARRDGRQAQARVKVTQFQSAPPRSFRNEIIPMLTRAGCNSGACHGALAGKGGLKLSLRGYDPEADHFAMTRQALGRRIDRTRPERSLLLLKPTMTIDHGGGLKLDVDGSDFRLLADWIAAGAPGPREDDVRIQRIEVFPAEAVLQPGDALQVLVRAWYSDGTARDVTGWSKFSSSEELIAAVDDAGRVDVAGHGEAAVTVWYSNQVASVRIAAPLPEGVPPAVFAGAARRGFIDDLVLKKLQALNIPPSGDCSDNEFIRRAYLDAAGILPTPEEVERFIADRAPDRRAKLVDAILRRPEFVDYWTYRWSDLLLVSSRKLPQPAVWAYYQFIRQGVADNKPWDRFARDILTASGSNLDSGAANYFVLHKDVADLTETTAVTFLGTSITCARCHNHPLEKWTQDQYWGLASLFSRVGMKNGDRPGEVLVQPQPIGEVLHLRRGIAMPPTPLDGQPLPADSAKDRRHYFADWLTAPENPFFARAIVNRVWRNFLGRGLVEAEDDLRQTNPPTNPELLDALAADFVRHGHDIRHLIRQIMNSAAYQRSSQPLPANAADDRFYSHYLIRRLPAEVILDAYSQVTGVPTPFTQVGLGTGGLKEFAGAPLGTRALQLPDSMVVSPFLDGFGRPERGQTCSCERQQDSSVGQALHLNNGKTLNDKLRAGGGRMDQWWKEKISDAEAVRRLFQLALSREPTAAEAQRFASLLDEASRDPASTRREVLEDLFWAVLTGREFLFNR